MTRLKIGRARQSWDERVPNARPDHPSPKTTGRQSGFRFGTTSDTGRDALCESEINGRGRGISPTFGRLRGALIKGIGSIMKEDAHARRFS
jgi:hypothetical protein